MLPIETLLGTGTTAGTAFIRIKDFNEDQRPDVLVLAHNESPVIPAENVLFLNNGVTFDAFAVNPGMAVHEGNTGDFNGDGYPDFIASAFYVDADFSSDPLANDGSFGSMMLFINDQAGGFDSWPLRFNMAVEGIPENDPRFNDLVWINGGSASAFGNLDNDPEPEVVVTDNCNGPSAEACPIENWVIDNIQFESGHAYGDLKPLPLPYLETNPHFDGNPSLLDPVNVSHDIQVELLDFDQDGDNDIVINSMIYVADGRDAAGVVQFLQNDGSGNFTDVTEDTLFNYNLGARASHDPRYMDVNADGFVDILMVEEAYVEPVPHQWTDFFGEIQKTVDNTWPNEILINTGTGKFVSTFWQGFNELTLRQEALFRAAGVEFEPYELLDYPYFPYLLEDGRLGFVTNNRGWENTRFWFDVRSNGPIHTGPRGSETASLGVPGYSEYFYLVENADVRDLVASGEYADGLSHFIAVGRDEGRESFARNTHVHGHDGVDRIVLREGDERATGYGGDDIIDGEEGFDTAVFLQPRSEYRISKDGNTYYVMALSGSDGRDTLVDMEAGAWEGIEISFVGDEDSEGAPNWQDLFPFNTALSGDTDGDGQDNNIDTDDDNDGVPDASDEFSLGRFDDVDPASHFAFFFIEALERSGITGGCGPNLYCPEDPVTRAQMAVFHARGINGAGFIPPAATGNVFADVRAGAFAANYIERLFADGITAGCGGGNYCPNDSVTRAQMAVFLLRARYGADYLPPPATGIFADVPVGSFADAFVEQLAAEGITAGCGNGNYCPDDPITRAQMAVFLVRTFAL
jgi:hypothetical protein